MKKILACATSCYGNNIDLYPVLEDIAALGFTGVEFMSIPFWFDHFSPDRYSNAELGKILKVAKQLGLAVPAICAHCPLGKPEGAGQLATRIRMAADFGINKIVTGAGNLQGQEEEALFFAAIAQALTLAEKFNVMIFLETGGTYHPTGQIAASVVDRFESDHFQLAYDPANVALWGKIDPIPDIQPVMGKVKHVHIKEFKSGYDWHPPLGTGDIDFNAFFLVLKKWNYPGDFSIEIDLHGGDFHTAHNNLQQSLTYLHEKTNFDECFGR